MTRTEPSSATSPPTLSELPSPIVQPTPTTLAGPSFTPKQILYFHTPSQWEDFIREWATGLKASYHQIKRLGGSGDRGVDIAAFKTRNGFEGAWDCFQGKHYANALMPSDAWPEILKIFLGVLDGHYCMPDSFLFLAPKGCGATLDRLLSRPSEFRRKFLVELENSKGCAASLETDLREQVRILVDNTDFSMFGSVQLEDALMTHRGTPYHQARFGGPIPSRPPSGPPPKVVAESESGYIEKLIEAYAEQMPGEKFAADSLDSHPKFGEHFRRQRVSFYSAEALYMHARDSVPDGTFEALQEDVYSGVIEVAEAEHDSGLGRLREVLTAATNLQLDGHAVLMSVSRTDDRKGICHQLANQNRIGWVGTAHA